MRFYYGPKVFEELRAIDPELTRAINFGMFAVLAVPLLGALKWVQGFVGNWGWSIVVLTILINIAMFPFRHKSVVSMRKMQAIQPQMKAIQERYAKYKITDPERQKMNTEVMELYKAKGVNPASGCVPMLLTLPFLIAFYSMLQMAIEIRGANFAGWITNLSAPDPYFILPVAMGAVQFWQTRIQPATGRSRAAAHHDVHAADVRGDVVLVPERAGALLAGQHPVHDRAAVLHELLNWRAGQSWCKITNPDMATADITEFVQKIVDAMDLDLEASAEEMPDGVRINLDGDDGNVLIRRQGEALAALQHIVAAVYRHESTEGRRLVVDCMGYRKGKDEELRQMALFLGGKAKDSGLAQEIGPLNPYERRIVHLAVAELGSVTSESIGDAFEKTVIISVK